MKGINNHAIKPRDNEAQGSKLVLKTDNCDYLVVITGHPSGVLPGQYYIHLDQSTATRITKMPFIIRLIPQSHHNIHCFCWRSTLPGDKSIMFVVEPEGQKVNIYHPLPVTQVLEHLCCRDPFPKSRCLGHLPANLPHLGCTKLECEVLSKTGCKLFLFAL